MPNKNCLSPIFYFLHIPLWQSCLMKSHCRWTLQNVIRWFQNFIDKTALYYWNAHWAIPEKILDILFWIPAMEFLNLSLYPQKFQRKQGFTPTLGNSAELCCTSCKFQGQKPKDPSMEIPQTVHEFFLKTPRNSASFLTHP